MAHKQQKHYEPGGTCGSTYNNHHK